MRPLSIFAAIFALMGVHLMAGPPPTPTMADVSYGPEAHQLMDICVPPKGDGPFPVVLF